MITPNKRVETILRTIAANFVTAADAIKDGDERKMINWTECGLKQLEPLLNSIELLHPDDKSVIRKFLDNNQN